MAIIPELNLPEWGDSGDPPSQDIIDNGWSAGDGIPSVWLNWFFYNVLKTLNTINQEAITAEAVEENLGTLPQDVENINKMGRFYRFVPDGVTKLLDIRKEGMYFIPNILLFTDAPTKNSLGEDLVGTPTAFLSVVEARSYLPSTTSSFLIQRLFINDGAESQHVAYRHVIALTRPTPSAKPWFYELTSAGGVVQGDISFNKPANFNQQVFMYNSLNVATDININGPTPLQFRKSSGKRWVFWLENGENDIKGDNIHFAPSATNGNTDWDYTKGYSINTNTGLVTLKNGVVIKGNGANLKLYGNDHSYIDFYPQGEAGGRQGYIGFPSAAAKELNINATDSLKLVDKSGTILLSDIIAALVYGNIAPTFLEIGYNRSNNAASFIDLHSTVGKDYDGRIIVDTDRNMSLQSPNRIYFSDQWRTMSLDGIYNDIQTLKQSGVDTKQGLVDALNAKRLASSISETFTELINKIYAASTARDIGINGDAYTMNSYDGDFGTYTDPAGSGWRHSYASIFLYNHGNFIQFTPNLQYNSSAQFYLGAGGRGQITLRDDGERAIDIFPMYTWQPSGAGSGNRILLQLYSFTIDKATRVATVIRDFANPSDGVASQPRQKFYIQIPSDFNLNGALRLRLNVGLPNGGYAANGQIAGRLYY